ncbi:hypothetical protein D477_004414, partial [Arthrobacter crystallopoietes BAB-32]
MPALHYDYGPDPSQYAELYLPSGRKRTAVVVIVHGGYWRARYAADLGAPAAAGWRR